MRATPFPTRAAALALAIGLAVVASPAQAQFGREPTACMRIATDFADRLVGLESVEPLIEAQRAALERLDAIAAQEEVDAMRRLQDAEALMRGRELWELQRQVRTVQRVLDTARSVVAGWRGLYCPVARPTGAQGLEGQDRCDALSAIYIDRLRIDRPSPEFTRAREAREAERQTILKARVTRAERDDLLSLWRLRSEAFETLRLLERAQTLREASAALLGDVAGAGCAPGRQS